MRPQTESTGRRRGFFRSLFDLSFTSFITGRVVSFVYVLSLIFVVLYVLGTVGYSSVLFYTFFSAFAESQAAGIVAGVALFVIFTPILLLVAVVYLRVLLEIVVVLFRISEDTAELVRQGQANSSQPVARTPPQTSSQAPPDEEPPETRQMPRQP